ncbi:hypothetical protein GCM10011390_21920 [Aureimonas endophytica]|uniref:DUF2442 domain-containing protein n=1 Tax=Aureimonas endophytica TaxID=2027858 RepID=A0A917E4F7_9HYPH|nr:DUF2442 domain-containing protein [Aureimonas endophytica]GGE02657.1 hypothetical protein GCM10011390_21920 [Aureimonas endophytica]
MEAELSDAELDAADERGRKLERSTPQATGARYDAETDRLVIDFANGSTFMVPPRLLQGLEDASSTELAEVEVRYGYALRWPSLDVDFTVPGVVAGIFGTASYMAAHAGRTRSAAKAAASRANGKKGGRPRKTA